jgi:hypothetical protein
MPSREQVKQHPFSNPNCNELKALFKQCEKQEKAATRPAFLRLRKDLANALVWTWFDRGFFGTGPEPVTSASAREKKILRAIDQGAKYDVVLELLRKALSSEARLMILAWWLKQEGVCEPHQFLPRETVKKLCAEGRKRLKGMSFQDLRYFYLIRIWLPYFERLLNDLRELSGDPEARDRLAKAGYRVEAVECAIGRREPVPAVCEWVSHRLIRSPRKEIDARTLQNAYTRFQGRTEKPDQIL